MMKCLSNRVRMLNLFKRTSFSVQQGGVGLRSIDVVHLTVYICYIAASALDMSLVFPEWMSFDRNLNQLQITDILILTQI